jgi:ketol-acid reductoisomerase
MSKTAQHTYTQTDFFNAYEKLPENKQSKFTLMGHQTALPAGHKVAVAKNAMFHAPAAIIDALHSQVMSKKTEDVAKPAKDTKQKKATGLTKEEKTNDRLEAIRQRIQRGRRDDQS